MLTVGVVYHVYALTGSTAASAVLMFASIAPQVLLGPLAGVWVDRWDRKRVMVTANLLMAVTLAPLLLVHAASQVWIFFTVMVVQNSLATVFTPAEQATLPLLVPEQERTRANALYGQNQNIARLAGSALGGVAVASGGMAAVALADAASFLIAAALVAPIASMQAAHDATLRRTVGDRIAAVRDELADGIAWMRRHHAIRVLAVFMLFTSTGEGVMGTLFSPFVRTILHDTNADYGTVLAAQALGGIVGGLVAAAWAHKASPARLCAVGAVLFGALDLSIFLYPLAYAAVWPAVVGMLLVGLPGAVMTAALMTLFQNGTEDRNRGRVFAALSAIMGLSALCGVAAAGLLAPRIGIVPVIAFQGAGYILAGLGIFLVLRPQAGAAQSSLAPSGAPPA